MKHFDVWITTQETPGLCKVLFWKKSGKTCKKLAFLKNGHFWCFSLIFSLQNETLQRAEVFCVAISASKRFNAHHSLCVTCYMSHVTCYMSHVMCHVSHVLCHVACVK